MSCIITATGTDVGKTWLCSLIMAKYGASRNLRYWKPFQTGSSSDTAQVMQNSNLGTQHFLEEMYAFSLAAAPKIAAENENSAINMDLFFSRFAEYKHLNLVIEGAGGLYVPLNNEFFIIDMIAKLELPVILVVSSLLGTINSSLLSLNAMKSRNIPVAGFYMIGEKNPLLESNIMTIENFSRSRFLGYAELDGSFLSSEKFISQAVAEFDPEGRIGELL